MFDFTQHVSTRLRRLVTPQAERIPDTKQLRLFSADVATERSDGRKETPRAVVEQGNGLLELNPPDGACAEVLDCARC